MSIYIIILAILNLQVANSKEKIYNILAIDGGGIRGILPAGILEEVEKYVKEYADKKSYNIPKYYNP